MLFAQEKCTNPSTPFLLLRWVFVFRLVLTAADLQGVVADVLVVHGDPGGRNHTRTHTDTHTRPYSTDPEPKEKLSEKETVAVPPIRGKSAN